MSFKKNDRVFIRGTVDSVTAGLIAVSLDSSQDDSPAYYCEASLTNEEDALTEFRTEFRSKLEVKTNELNDVDAALKGVPGTSRIEKLLGVLSVLRTQKMAFQNSMMLEDGQIIYGELQVLMAVRGVIQELDSLKRDYQQGLKEECEKTLAAARLNIEEALKQLGGGR